MRFKLLLFFLGLILSVASRLSARLRGQLSRDMTVIIASYDGVARAFTVLDRKISTFEYVFPPRRRSRCTLGPRLSVSAYSSPPMRLTKSSTASAQAMLCARARQRIYCGSMNLRWAYYPGVRSLSTFGQIHIPRPIKTTKSPTALFANPRSRSLDPASLDGHKQREKTILWGVGRGATPWGKVKGHKIVVELDASAENQA